MSKFTTNSTPSNLPPISLDSLLGAITRLPPAKSPPPRIVESELLTIPHEDWSQVRSPSRAERRRKQGHRQNIIYTSRPSPDAYRIGNAIHIHPETLKAALAASNAKKSAS